MLHRRKVSEYVCTQTDPVVETATGKVRGFRVDGVNVFRGIPYAQAKRFQMPEPFPAWSGVRDALAYGPGCPHEPMSFYARDRQDLDVPLIHGRWWVTSEDPQNLNIWTQHLSPGARRPVMVWLHGGGFSGGSATHLYSYDGFEMAFHYDVVLVSVNHRVNMLGFLNLSQAGENFRFSGNAGMADLIAALKWVRDNIAAFGGDPNNVTIFGQSGGARKVTTLMQMPDADGLYHRAIAQSGSLGQQAMTAETSSELAERALAHLGLTFGEADQMAAMDYEAVGQAVRAAMQDMNDEGKRPRWAPLEDGEYYVGSPLRVGFRKENLHIPMIVGSCVAEFARNIPKGNKAEWTDEMRYAALRAVYGEDSDRIREAFSEAYPRLDWSYAAAVDLTCRPGILEFMALRCQQSQAPMYNYVFTFESLHMGGQLTGHNGDLHFMFHNASYMESVCVPGVTQRLEDDMAGAWTQFAASGHPNRQGLTAWESYTLENGACMLFGAVTEMRHFHDRSLMEALQPYRKRPVRA